MSPLPFTDQRGRLRRIVSNALHGTTYEASHEEDSGRILILEARRSDSQRILVRFRGVKSVDSTETPPPGSPLKLRNVGPPGNFLQRLFESSFRQRFGADSRVTIEAGDARIDIVCQDAEWWEEPAGPKV